MWDLLGASISLVFQKPLLVISLPSAMFGTGVERNWVMERPANKQKCGNML